jgi:hypothetical protein
MKKRLALAAYIFIFLYGCSLPLQKNACETGYIDNYSFWNEYIDEYLFFNTCYHRASNLFKDPKYVSDGGDFVPRVYRDGLIYSWLTFLLLWFIRWAVTGKHFWQRPETS